MKIFIWYRVDHATDNYHHEGGISIIAGDLGEAREQLHKEKVPPNCGAFHYKPDHEFLLGQLASPAVFVFPDAGCC